MNNAVETARVGALHAVLSVALSARQATLRPEQVEEMRGRVIDALPAGDDLRASVIAFASRYAQLKRDTYALRLLGEELHGALQIRLNPEAQAPARYRGDVDG